MWCSAAATHLKLLDRAVSGVWFLTRGVFECDIAHHRSVSVLCMLYNIRCKPMHYLNGALPRQSVPMRVTHSPLVANQSVYLCATSLQNLTVEQDFYSPLSVLERSSLPRIRGCVTGEFQEQGQCFLLA